VTSLGDIVTSQPFANDAQVPINLSGIPATIDFSRGAIDADILPRLPGGEVEIPLSSLSGTATFSNGLATIQIPFPFSATGQVSGSFDVSQLADNYITDYFDEVTGNLVFSNGTVTSNLTGPFGSSTGNINLVQLVNEAIAVLQGTQGTVTIRNGLLTSNLTTPKGSVTGSLNLVALADQLEPVLDLVNKVDLIPDTVV
jgi:hypothetical protein